MITFNFTLIVYIDDVLAETRTTRTDREGRFQFANLITRYQYLVSARYAGVDYYYHADFGSGEPELFVEVPVCDVTTSDEAIRIGLAHAVIDVEEECLLATEVFWLINDGDRTYVGTGDCSQGILIFTLPEGATDFNAPQELMQDYRLLDNNRVAYLVPFPPGERQLVYSYKIARNGLSDFNLLLEIDYPTDSLDVMVEGEDIEVSSTQLAPAEPVNASTGEKFIHFRGESIPRGTVINLHLSSLSGGSGLSSVSLWVIIAVVIISLTVYLMRRMKREDTIE